MRFNVRKNLHIILLSIVVSSLFSVCAFGAIPSAYWKVQQPFISARDAGNNSDIIKYGKEIITIFKDKPLEKDKAEILYTTYEAMYKAYENTADYGNAIEILKAQISYGEYLGFADGVKLAKERINKINPMTQVYAVTQNTSSVPFYGMKNEPKSGTYYGRVYSDSGVKPMENETAVSFYFECLQDNLEDFDYLIRPYADGNRLIHIAMNMPGENDTLKLVMQTDSDAYLKETMEYLKSLNVPVLLRIGGEMNVWQNLADPSLYKQAYIKIANVARQTAPNVALVFSPNDVSNWNVDISDYYPGDSYVDWVGVSLYTNKYRNPQNPVVGKDFEEMYYGNGAYANPLSKLKNIVARYGSKKPIIITECGVGYGINGKTLDLNSFAKERIQMLYSYANMLYPQVKGIVYFDVDLGSSNKYLYSLSNSSQMMNQYQAFVESNEGFIKQMGGTPKAYVKAGSYQDNLPVIELATYCILPGNIPVTVEYSFDGKKVISQGQIPYTCNIDASTVSTGIHELKVLIKSSNGYNKTKAYMLTKQENNLINIKEK
ncbi:MAG: glycosyl hydrolase [Anaerotignum propionicum]|nr:glycosyl hydrolase [Anaerotignum propionicum]MEA5056462.1 glycosyl hydrolase [Anaerotignum propionicum]